MSIEKHYVNEADWGCGCFILTRERFRIMRYYILPACTTKQEENNVGRDKRSFGQ